MAENKKKLTFFTIKRRNSQKLDNSLKTPPVSISQDAPKFFKNQTLGGQRLGEMKPRRSSAGGIKDLIQCPLCLEVLHNAKMLPCQHTFCMACLTVYIADAAIIECPICATKIQTAAPNFLENLPSNLYIDSLLNLVGAKSPSSNSVAVDVGEVAGGISGVVSKSSSQGVELFAGGVRCSGCQTMCDSTETTACVHCKLNFCMFCWSQHVDDMRTQIGSILKQLDSANTRLEHKTEYFKDHCERLVEQITIAADEKIASIIETKQLLLQKAAKLQKTGEMQALALKISMEDTKDVANKAMTSKDDNSKGTVTTFINLHHNAIQLLSDVSKWDTKSFFFDKDNFSIEEDATTPYEAESEEPLPEGAKHNNPLESEDSLAVHYRSRNFAAHYVFRKVSRPAGVAVSPWSNDLYVCGMDMHAVLVVERSQAKIVARLSCEEMLCPVYVAFMKGLGEIYVTDKWKHCIHVFSKDGEHLRSIGQKGSRDGMFRSPEGIATDNAKNLIYVVDTGNDRVQIIQPDGRFVDQIGVTTKPQPLNSGTVWESKDTLCTELSAPTSVAVTNDRVIILDSGHRRVKIYNKADKCKLGEFGAMGQRKGQFRQPEVLAVDPMGFILVGDSGNCRVQVFKPNGQLVRVFGGLGTGPNQFGWISGIHVTKQLDVIISDTKNHCVNFY